MKDKKIVFACMSFVILVLCLFSLDDKINAVSVSVNSFSVKVEKETQEEETSTELLKEDLLDKSKQNLVKKLEIVRQYLSVINSDKTVEEFTDWFCKNYGLDIVNELANNNGVEISRDFYTQTGKSLFVLCDEFLENTDVIHKTAQSGSEVNIMFAGDICLAEDGFVLDYYDTTTGIKDCISEEIINRTNTADIFMLNNEFTYSDRGTALPGKLYTFRANPARVSILQELGVDIASLANNHVYDFGQDAFEDTVNVLKNAGITPVGGGADKNEAEKVIYYEINGIKIGIVSASRAENVRYTPGAKDASPGVFLMYDDTRLCEVIQSADKQCDYLIAYIHWGTEDSKYFEEYQHAIAEKMINSGVDAIIGGHPHILQGMEYINGKPVVYSLGDFWFNGETKYNGLVNLKVDINGLSEMSYIPCVQKNFTTEYIDDAEEQRKAYDYLRELSPNVKISEDGKISQ